MAIIKRRDKFYVTTYIGDSKTDWSKPFNSRREAEAEQRRIKRARADGTYRPEGTGAQRFGTYFAAWLRTRTTRNASGDRSLAKLHLQHRDWLMKMTLEEIEERGGPSALRLVKELKATISEETGKPLSPKYVSNLYGMVTSCLRSAQVDGLIRSRPFVLERNVLRRSARRGARSPYTIADLRALTKTPSTGRVSEGQMFAALAFYLGGREGELCGRRFSDIDPRSTPLACMEIATQYDDRMLKTDKHDVGDHARKVPVHPRLVAILDAWWRTGFEFTYCRRPRVSDHIVPRRFVEGASLPHTKSSAYKLWIAHCFVSGVKNLSLHSTRHTFISMVRRSGVVPDWVVERLTHNASGTVVDQYTHAEWDQLCKAVLGVDPIDPGPDGTGKCVDTVVDAVEIPRLAWVEAPGIEPYSDSGSAEKDAEEEPPPGHLGGHEIRRDFLGSAPENCARQFPTTDAHTFKRREPGRPRRLPTRGPEPTKITRRAIARTAADLELAARLDAGVALALDGNEAVSLENLAAMAELLRRSA